MSEFSNPCEYCGTLLNDDEQEESNVAACGPRMTHYASTCRERVLAALRYTKTQLATALRERDEVRGHLATAVEALEYYANDGDLDVDCGLVARRALAAIRAPEKT